MSGVKLGERFAQIGCTHGGRLGAIASKVGLSGRAIAFVPDQASAERARKGAADAGVLLEVEITQPTQLPVGEDELDLVVVDDTEGLLGSMQSDARDRTILEARRILRPGGRLIVIGSGKRTGLAALLARPQAGVTADPTPALHTGGFKSVRTLAEREGLIFVEGLKPRAPST
jgi:SAM-dependent methyltransferase